jgi:hypothetical protein
VLIDAGQKRWIVATVVLAVLAVLLYLPYALMSLNGPSGASWPGLAYGIAGLALMVYAGIIGLRRKVPTWRVGRASTWMRGHLWLGLLSYVLIHLHAGFDWGGPLTFVTMVLFTIVIASGVWGVILQQILPRMMLEQLPLETVYEQVDSVVGQLRADADELVGALAGPLPIADPLPPKEQRGGGGLPRGEAQPVAGRGALVVEPVQMAALRDTYLNEIRPYLGRELPRNGRVGSPTGRDALFGNLKTILPPPTHGALDELRGICEERRQLAQQKRMQHWLHGWLLVHVPLSMALLLLGIVHAVIALRY